MRTKRQASAGTYAAIVLVCSSPATAVAQESTGDKHARLTYDGVVYEYQSIPRWDSNGKLMYYTGQMSGRRDGRHLEFFQKTQQSPGCDMDFPAISLIDVPYQKVSGKKTYVLFCGSYGGRQSTLKFYDPSLGIVSSFNLGNFGPALAQEDAELDLTIFREIHPKSIDTKLVYPTIYSVFSNNGPVILKDKEDDDATKLKYAKRLEHPYYLSKNYWVITEKMIISSLAGDTQSYCNLAENFSNKLELFGEIEAAIGFPLIQCNQ